MSTIKDWSKEEKIYDLKMRIAFAICFGLIGVGFVILAFAYYVILKTA